ncbi:MAG: hypothetical protein LBP85_05630 [Prevotellaceae bacterium]|jgi:hypothetical protein|nr:hypothetical protein [Prevotellaceae bacterium]
MDKTNYSTKLTEKQYEVIKNFLETKIRKRKHLLKELLHVYRISDVWLKTLNIKQIQALP